MGLFGTLSEITYSSLRDLTDHLGAHEVPTFQHEYLRLAQDALMVARWHDTFQPFSMTATTPALDARHMVGVFWPSAADLEAWHTLPPGHTQPFALHEFCQTGEPSVLKRAPTGTTSAVIYIELSPVLMWFCEHPLRDTLCLLSNEHGGFHAALRREKYSPSLRLRPMLGLDHIPIALMVDSARAEDIWRVAEQIRRLTLDALALPSLPPEQRMWPWDRRVGSGAIIHPNELQQEALHAILETNK